jgi:hypothetical protein
MTTTGFVANSAMPAEVSTTPVIPMVSAPNGCASETRPPMVMPISDPAPNSARTAGTDPSGNPVVSVSMAPR